MRHTFGEFMRTLRVGRGLTLRRVEELADVSNAYLSQVERGERGVPNIKVLRRLADAYDVPVSTLIEAAEVSSKRSTAKTTTIPEFVSRGYEKLSAEKKRTLESFLEHLVEQETKKSKRK